MRSGGRKLAVFLSGALLILAVLFGLGLVGVVIGGFILGSGALGTGPILADLTAEGASPASIVVTLVSVAALGMGSALILVLLLRRVLRRVAHGEPFHRSNPRDLQLIAALLAFMEVAGFFIFLVLPRFLALPAEIAKEMRTEFSFDLTSWFSILVVLVLAEVFREGARLRAEAELTV